MAAKEHIERDAAIEMIWSKPDLTEDQKIALIGRMQLIPAAKTERFEAGKWKHIRGDEWVCPSCGYIVTTEGSWEHPLDRNKRFCENCGADMREEREDV